MGSHRSRFRLRAPERAPVLAPPCEQRDRCRRSGHPGRRDRRCADLACHGPARRDPAVRRGAAVGAPADVERRSRGRHCHRPRRVDAEKDSSNAPAGGDRPDVPARYRQLCPATRSIDRPDAGHGGNAHRRGMEHLRRELRDDGRAGMEHRLRPQRGQGRGRAMRLHPRSGADSALAAIATLVAAWPISTLLQEPTWLRGTVTLLAVIAMSGFAARSVPLRGWQVLTVQLVCSVLAAGALYGRGHLWHGLPTFETLGFAGGLIRESLTTAQKFAAPAPTTPGLIFVVGCSLGLVALMVDYLAVTLGSPSLAGLPLLTVFLAAVANRGSTLPVIFFLAVAAMWLILVARADGTILRRWGTTSPVTHSPAPQSLASQGLYEHSSMARIAGAVALVAAVAVPLALPHASPTFLLSGLGRSSTGNGNGPQGVGFSQSIDLAQDLKSRSRAPVLQYTTADTSDRK